MALLKQRPTAKSTGSRSVMYAVRARNERCLTTCLEYASIIFLILTL